MVILAVDTVCLEVDCSATVDFRVESDPCLVDNPCAKFNRAVNDSSCVVVESDPSRAVDPFVGLDCVVGGNPCVAIESDPCVAIDPSVGLDCVVGDNPSVAVEYDPCLAVEPVVELDCVVGEDPCIVLESCVESSLKIMFLKSTIENMVHDKPVSVSVEVISVLVAVSSEKRETNSVVQLKYMI